MKRVEKERRIWHACTHTERERTVGCFIFFGNSAEPDRKRSNNTQKPPSFFFFPFSISFPSRFLPLSLIFPSCRFHRSFDRQPAARSRRMMMTMPTTRTSLSMTTRRISTSDDDDDAKRISSSRRAIVRWFMNAYIYILIRSTE